MTTFKGKTSNELLRVRPLGRHPRAASQPLQN